VSAGICSALSLAPARAVAGVSAAAGASAAAASAAAGAGARVPVIVFMKNQPAASSGSHLRSSQQLALVQHAEEPYRDQLAQLGATGVRSYRLVDALAARVPAAAVGDLAASPGVAAVIPDSPIIGPGTGGPGAAAGASPGLPARRPALNTPAGACSSTPQLEPEGLSLTHTDSPGTTSARSLGYTGAGVRVAFLADGVYPFNANLERGGHPVITDYQDFSGDGTATPTPGGEAFLDANAIAGQGRQVYNVSAFGARPTATACRIRIEGMAPGASLVALKVFSNANVSTTSGFLQAIDYAVTTARVNVINESFGANPFPDLTSLDAVKEFNDMAVAAGVTVVVASGDAGPANTIGSPASDPRVISVGASTDFRFYAQTNYAAADQFGAKGWLNNNISSLSSGGFTEDGRTLDLVAPGDLSFSSCTPDKTRFFNCVNFLGHNSPVEESGGASQSSPEVAGIAALVIQAYRKAHGGMSPSPAIVKQILLSTAGDLGAPATEQGSGLVNALKAVEVAAYICGCRPLSRHADQPGSQPVLLSANQLNFTGKPGATASWAVSVTNAGTSTQTYTVAGRRYGATSVVKEATVTLSDTASPHFTNWAGVQVNYGLVRFTVPPGQLLDTSIAWSASAAAAGDLNARVRLILFDPHGRMAAHSMPQGVGGYGSAQVLHPVPGDWTAVIFSDVASVGGTHGRVLFGATVSRYRVFGTVSPTRLTLAPGASGVVRISAKVPAGAGDSSGALLLSAGRAVGDTVSVPVTLRGQVAAGLGAGGTFSGVLTGGNGRAPGEGQVASYSFVVPNNLPVLLRVIDADIVLANDPLNQVSGYLVGPGGQTMGYGSNFLTTGFTSTGVPVESPRRELSVFAAYPVPGVWTLIVDFTSPVPGNELADPFKGRIRFNSMRFHRGGLPDKPSVVLPAGKAVSYPIRITNTGVAAEDVFLDPRLLRQRTYTLQPQNTVEGVKLPVPATANPPEWIVPTMTGSVSGTARSTVPVMFDFAPFPGDPDQASSAGLEANATFPLVRLKTPVTQGLWFAMPSQVGPFPAGGATRTLVGLSMRATTREFDTTASSTVGDFWQFAVRPLAASATYNLFTINPGQTRTINLTIRPAGKPGTVVRGMVYIDDFVDSLQFLSGGTMMALPYAYTVGAPSSRHR
jgi:hypothetical protein